MPLYRTPLGVVVDIPQEKAARIEGLEPISPALPSPRKAAVKKITNKRPAAFGDKD